MKYIIVILFSFVLFCLYSEYATAIDYEQYKWESATIEPQRYADNGYWLEFWFLPDNPQYGYAVGYILDANGVTREGIFAKTNDSGLTWKASTIASGFHAESVHFVDTLVGYASGPRSLYKTTNGGNTWRVVETIRTVGSYNQPGGYVEGIWGNYAIGDTVWVMDGKCYNGSSQYFFRSDDAGQTWKYTAEVSSNDHLTDITILEPDGLGYATGSYNLWITQDGGRSWNILNRTPAVRWDYIGTSRSNWHEDLAIYNSSFLIPLSPGCSGGMTNEGALAFSNNFGTDWNTYITDANMYGTFLLNDSTGWGCGISRAVYYTTNYGKTWIEAACGIKASASLDDLWFFNDSCGFVCGDGIYRLVRRTPDSINVAGDTIKCSGELVALVADGNYSEYNWYQIDEKGDTTWFAEGKNISVDTGTYFVKYVDDWECEYAASEPIHIVDANIPDLKIHSDDSIYCKDDSINLWVIGIQSVHYGLAFGYFVLSDIEVSQMVVDSLQGVEASATLYGVEITGDNPIVMYVYGNDVGCTDTAYYSIKMSKASKPNVELSGNTTFCKGGKARITLTNASAYTQWSWFNEGNNIANDVPSIDITANGKYYVIASFKGKCVSTSDTIEVRVIEAQNVLSINLIDSVLFVDSVNYGGQSSAFLEITNSGDVPFTLYNAYFLQKTCFTIAMHQLPLVIPAKATRTLQIFYSPTNLEWQYDTLVLDDNCGVVDVPLSGFGELKRDSSGDGPCNVELVVKTDKIVNVVISIVPPSPNPVNSQASAIKYMVSSAGNLQLDIDISVYNSLGDAVAVNYQHIENANGGEVILNVSDLQTGIYFVRFSVLGESKIFPIVVK